MQGQRQPPRCSGRRVFPDTARYLCDRRSVQYRNTDGITLQFLMLLENDDLEWVVQDAIIDHAITFREAHWEVNMELVTRWVVIGKPMTFEEWTEEQGYQLFFNQFIGPFEPPRAFARRVFPDTARYLCDRRMVHIPHAFHPITFQWLMLLENGDLEWVLQDTIEEHANRLGQPHWSLNMGLVARWVISERRLTFLDWTQEQGYDFIFDRFYGSEDEDD